MKKYLSAGLMLVILAALLAGCGDGGPRVTQPFTFDYKLDESNAKFFANNDDIDMLLSSSPFYTGAQPLPFKGASEFYRVRTRKVEEIIANADKVVKSAQKTKGGLAKIRKAYVDYLDVLFRNDPKAEEFVRKSLNDVILAESRAAVAEATYESMDTTSDNALAKSYMQYLKVIKGCEVGAIYLQDADNIVCSAAGALLIEQKTTNAKIREANEKLDREMKAFDSIKGGLGDVAFGLGTVHYGFRQLSTADYYFARSAVKFMTDGIPAIKEKMAGVKPNANLSAEDIAFINASVGSFGKLAAEMQEYLDSVDRSGLVDVSRIPDSIFPSAYADDAPNDYVNGYKAAAAPVEKPEGWTLRGALSTGWNAAKTVVHGAQSTAGLAIDLTGLAVRNPTRAVMGFWYGNTWEETWEDMRTNAREVTDNWRLNRSGSETLMTAYKGFTAAEKGAEEGAKSLVGKLTGDGTANWLAGKVAGLTVGLFTGLGKGITLVANRQALPSDYVIGALEIGFAVTGGSKLVIKGSQAPGFLKGLSEGVWLSGKKLANFVSRALARGERSQLRGLLKEAVERGVNVAPQVAGVTERILAEQAVLTSLRLTGKQLTQQLRGLIVSGLKAGGQNTLSTWKKSLFEFTKKQFELNMQGVGKALAAVLGNSAKEYLDNIIGQGVEDALKAMVDEALRGCPEPEELAGKWTGTTVFTEVELPTPEQAKKEGCDLDFTSFLKELKGKSLPTSIKLSGGPSGGGAVIVLTINGENANPFSCKYTYSRASGEIRIRGSQQGASLTYAGKAARAGDHYEIKGRVSLNFGSSTKQGAYMSGNWKVMKK